MELLVKYGASIQAITEVRHGVGTRSNICKYCKPLCIFSLFFPLLPVWSDSHPCSCFYGPPQHRITSSTERSIARCPKHCEPHKSFVQLSVVKSQECTCSINSFLFFQTSVFKSFSKIFSMSLHISVVRQLSTWQREQVRWKLSAVY